MFIYQLSFSLLCLAQMFRLKYLLVLYIGPFYLPLVVKLFAHVWLCVIHW